MNTKLKKFLIILIIILILILAGLLIYNFLIKKPLSNNGTNGLPNGNLPPGTTNGQESGDKEDEITPPGSLPKAKIKAISQEPVFAPTITADKNKVIYYLRSNGNVWEANFDGSEPNQVSSANLENLVKVIWSPNKSGVITIFQDNLENISKFFYSYTTKNALPLNRYINYIAWSPDSKKIAYQYQNESTDDVNISTANPDGLKYSVLFNTRMKNLIVEWPQGNEIFLREKPSGIALSSLYSLNSLTRTFNKVLSDIYGLSIKWSVKGDKMLFSKTGQGGKSIGIFIANRNGSNDKPLDIGTLAEKCVWSQDIRFVYCAIPKNIGEAKILPDDFYKGTFVANDEFYKINTGTNEKTNILEGETINGTFDATELFLSPNEDYLFFINKGDGLLYSIKL